MNSIARGKYPNFTKDEDRERKRWRDRERYRGSNREEEEEEQGEESIRGSMASIPGV